MYSGANAYGGNRHGDTCPAGRTDGTVVEALREPLVNPERFRQVQELLRPGPAHRDAPGQPHSHLLAGLLTCGVCGDRLGGKTRERGRAVHRYYVCDGRDHGSGMGPGPESVRTDLLDAAVADAVQTTAATA